MKNENTENIELENVVVPNDDLGDLIHALFSSGFSEEESDIVVDFFRKLTGAPEGSYMLDEEIIKLSDRFESEGFSLSEEGLDLVRQELKKRFT